MDRSDFEIVDGEPDIRGWDVKDRTGKKVARPNQDACRELEGTGQREVRPILRFECPEDKGVLGHGGSPQHAHPRIR